MSLVKQRYGTELFLLNHLIYLLQEETQQVLTHLRLLSLVYGGSSLTIYGRAEQWDAGVSIGAWRSGGSLNVQEVNTFSMWVHLQRH